MTLEQLEWHRHTCMPISTRINDRPLEGLHPLTINEVRQRYAREVANLSFVVWRSSAADRLGFKSGIDEWAWNTCQPIAFELHFCRPGKGPGNIALSVVEPFIDKTQLVLLSDRFDQASLDWFRLVAASLSKMFPNKITEHDDGYDA